LSGLRGRPRDQPIELFAAERAHAITGGLDGNRIAGRGE
jgi:hypothetical protein